MNEFDPRGLRAEPGGLVQSIRPGELTDDEPEVSHLEHRYRWLHDAEFKLVRASSLIGDVAFDAAPFADEHLCRQSAMLAVRQIDQALEQVAAMKAAIARATGQESAT